ncbi:hypothetical protein [Bradyrhizobium genosp. P]|uniref:hypothetical protein n=1 Tax=Bradyrhizobium genosp. P TaxID=83641 RepID=UPI003CECA36B
MRSIGRDGRRPKNFTTAPAPVHDGMAHSVVLRDGSTVTARKLSRTQSAAVLDGGNAPLVTRRPTIEKQLAPVPTNPGCRDRRGDSLNGC